MSGQDNELIKRAQAGSRQAFEALLQDHYDLIFRLAFRWCGNRADAEDVTQNACIKLAGSLGEFRFEAAFSSWLYRLVVNTAIDWQRANNKHAALDLDSIGVAETVPYSAEHILLNQEALAQVLALPEKEKTALLLVFSEGMSHSEAAAVMNCKESTVSWYIHRARKLLAAWELKRSANHV